jgi:predicted nucleic acid-binding protein
MIVIADTSPIIALVNIGHIDVLARMFGAVVVPTAVAFELADARRPQKVRDFIASPPAWLAIRSATTIETIPDIHAGEIEAISLASELKADLLLIDDADGRQAAAERGLLTVRTTPLLADAADRGMIDLQAAFDKLIKTDFRISSVTLETLLRQHRARHP